MNAHGSVVPDRAVTPENAAHLPAVPVMWLFPAGEVECCLNRLAVKQA